MGRLELLLDEKRLSEEVIVLLLPYPPWTFYGHDRQHAPRNMWKGLLSGGFFSWPSFSHLLAEKRGVREPLGNEQESGTIAMPHPASFQTEQATQQVRLLSRFCPFCDCNRRSFGAEKERMHQQEGRLQLERAAYVLYERYAASIFAYARLHTPSWEDAEDLTVEVFTAAFEQDNLSWLADKQQFV